ncbi:hypothetical protein [Nocardia sp. NPDC005366]|uniref:hypothetical protein n=1 Tax=Nocardia sp. NPDC005366 TaxID=3156878 RepID=UPI0033B53349
MNAEQATTFAAAIQAFAAGAERGHTAAVLELADMEGYLAALAESERTEAAVR